MKIAHDVAWVDARDLPDVPAEPAVYVTKLPDGAPLILEGAAWAVWTAISEDAPDLAARAAELLDVELTQVVRSDVAAFVDSLQAAALIR
jgi:hypothetical protein